MYNYENPIGNGNIHLFGKTNLQQGAHTPAHGLANTSRMRAAISHSQWQPWTAVLPLLGAHQHGIAVGSMNGENSRLSKTLFCRGECKHSFKRQLHTTHVGTVGNKQKRRRRKDREK